MKKEESPEKKIYSYEEKQAVRCPICGGNGLVDNGFYNQVGGSWTTSSNMPERCRSCNGKGYIII